MKNVARIMIVVLFAWVVLMFLLSSQDGGQTARTSEGIAYHLTKLVFGTTDSVVVEYVNTMLRKGAHIVLYFVLAVLLGIVTKRIAKGIPYGVRMSLAYLFLLFCCFFDEWHKQFIMGRHNDPRDVRLNIIGGTVGLLLTICVQLLSSEGN